MKKILSIFLALCFVFFAFGGMVSHASATASFSLKTTKYINGTNTEVSSASPLDTVTLQLVCNTPVQNVAGLSVTVYYDSNLLAFRERSETCHIVDAKAGFTSHAVAGTADKKAHVNVVWDTTAEVTEVSGPVFSLVFDVLGGAQSGIAAFSVTVNSMFLSDRNQTAVSTAAVPPKSLNIGALDLAPFEALAQGIRYDDATLQNIVAAETAFRALSSVQASAFVEAYPELYKVFSTARSTYNRLAQQAAQDAILSESKKFISDFADLWDLSTDSAALIDMEARILQAQTTYGALSDAAKSRIAAVYPQKLKTLLEKIDDFRSDIEEARDFREGEFALLWNLDSSLLSDVYTELFTMVDNAKIAYNGLSNYAKSLVVTQYEKLQNIEDLIAQYMQKDKETAALQEKTNAFMQKWSQVFVLNAANVKLEDKSAIEMAIKDSETLEPAVQTALASRIRNLQKLLTIISAYDKTTDNTPIIETVTETVVETVVETVPGETKTVVETVPGETVTKTVSKTIYSSLNKMILYLSALVLFGLVMTSIPAALLYSLNKAIKKHKKAE